MVFCERCEGPRSPGSARLCRPCYLGHQLPEETRYDLADWLGSERIYMEGETRRYFEKAEQRRDLPLCGIISRVLESVAESKLMDHVLEFNKPNPGSNV